jgi:hypothetical protein
MLSLWPREDPLLVRLETILTRSGVVADPGMTISSLGGRWLRELRTKRARLAAQRRAW